MKGVSQNTANNLGNYQSGYKPGDQASAAQAQLQQVQTQKPQGYNSKYGAKLDSILQQIQNPGQFKYEFNGDNLFKYYADKYVQQGKQASMDAMGQAAALTGGYGNSYGQQVGQQTYQQYLMDLYNVGLDLRDRAYQQYQDQLGNQKDVYGMMSQAEQQEYGKYRDTVGDWENERAFAAQQAENERDFDYNMYKNDLDYWTGLAQIENAAYNTEAEREEAIREYNQDYAESQRQFNETNTLNRDKLIEEQRQFNEGKALDYDRLAEEQRQFNEGKALDYDRLAEEQRQFDANQQYKYDELIQDQSQFNTTTQLNYDKLAQDQNQFDANLSEEQRQYNRNVAIDYVSSILANGQIPSNELLVAAGLSYEDAMKLIAEVSGGSGGSGGNGGDTSGGLTPQQIAKANWNTFLDNYWAEDAAKREELTKEAEEKNKQKNIENNKKTGNMTGVKKINYNVKTTK
jgi:hypothetical protein